jgi:hypothetical protein
MRPIEVGHADPLTLAVAAAAHVYRGKAPADMSVSVITEFHIKFHTGDGPDETPAWFFADVCGRCFKMLGIECQCMDPMFVEPDSWL